MTSTSQYSVPLCLASVWLRPPLTALVMKQLTCFLVGRRLLRNCELAHLFGIGRLHQPSARLLIVTFRDNHVAAVATRAIHSTRSSVRPSFCRNPAQGLSIWQLCDADDKPTWLDMLSSSPEQYRCFWNAIACTFSVSPSHRSQSSGGRWTPAYPRPVYA